MNIEKSVGTAETLLNATRDCLLETGYAGLSTRKVAEIAGVPLSQIHYHFGSKRGLVLALLEQENARLLGRQTAMYEQPLPLWRRWQIACDYLDEDVASGYVRILLEMVAAGWSEPEIAAEIRRMLRGWFALLTAVAREAGERFGGLGPFSPEDIASLVGKLFLGAEASVLIGAEEDGFPVRSALRKIGMVVRAMEEKDDAGT